MHNSNANEPNSDSFIDDCLSDLDSQPRAYGATIHMLRDPVPVEPNELDSKPGESTPKDKPGGESDGASTPKNWPNAQSVHLATSTFMSLVMVLALLLVARLLVPSLVESVRYSWYKGQLRAEYELSGERLRSVSLDSLTDVSQLVSSRVGPSVVHINLVPDKETIEKFEKLLGKQIQDQEVAGQGSGFVISSDGYIMTNHHVIEEVGSIEVTLADGRQLPATIVGTDPLTDLAVLKLEADDLLPCTWGNSEDVIVGTPVWAVGSPFGLQQTVTFGIISGKHRVNLRATSDTRDIPNTPYSDLMQSDVALNRGNSGGPLVDSQGDVVGVNAAILGDTFRGVSFSIPSHVAQRVARELIEKGGVERGWLGVQLADLVDEARFNEDGTPKSGVRVNWFPPVSPAKKAGIMIGDIITTFNGDEVFSVSQLIRSIGESTAGSTIEIGVSRKGIPMSFDVVLARRDPTLIR